MARNGLTDVGSEGGRRLIKTNSVFDFGSGWRRRLFAQTGFVAFQTGCRAELFHFVGGFVHAVLNTIWALTFRTAMLGGLAVALWWASYGVTRTIV